MKVYIKSLDLDFSLEYMINEAKQATALLGCDPICDLVLPHKLFSGLPKKFLTITIDSKEAVIEKIHHSLYITVNNEPLSKMCLEKGESTLQIMQYNFTILIKN